LNSPNIREQVKGKGENERLFCSQQPDITRFLDCAHDGKDVVAYIWSWVVKCPNCGFENPLVGQWWLVRKKKKKLYLNPSVDEGSLHIEIETGNNAPEGTCSNGKGRCLGCGSSISNETIKEDISKREKEILLAVVVSGRKGKNYGLPSDIDFLAFERARSQVKESWKLWEKDGLLPLEEIPKDTRGSLSVKIYLKDWHRLLNPRQTLLFTTLVKNIRNYGHKISEDYDEEYGKALAVYLSFVFGKHIDYNSRSSSWHRTNQQISSATGRRGVAIMWDHAEVNPFVKGSGTLLSMIQNILAGVNYSINKLAYGEVYAEVKYDSITSLNERIPLIVTDPPYYDDVRYAEFSEFFYSWERKALELFFEFGDVPKAEEMSVGGWGRTPEFFNTLFRLSCKKMHAMLTDDGMLVMFFAHSSVDAWDFVINSLQGARFRITATWPVHTESSVSLIARDHASIMSSIIIVARKRESEKSGYIEEIQEDVHDYLAKRLEEFWDYGLKGADLTVAAMGATLDIITQYSEIKSYTGEMKIKDILELVQGYVAEYVLNRYIEHSSGLDTATSFYLYSKLSQLDKMPYDTANLIAKSINVDLKIFQDHGLVALRKSGRSKGVMLLNYAEREFNGVNSLIDAVHLIMIAFSRGGYAEAEEELARVPYGRNEIKNILVAFQSLPPEDQERQVSQRILERMGYAFPKEGQMEIGRY
jgi:adenine-specific DNA methylase